MVGSNRRWVSAGCTGPSPAPLISPTAPLPLQVGYLLSRLLSDHPGMNVPVVREIERFMFRCGGAGACECGCAPLGAAAVDFRMVECLTAVIAASLPHCTFPPFSPPSLLPLLLPRRPGLQERARYYSVVYLNQMVLTHKPAAAQQQKGECRGCVWHDWQPAGSAGSPPFPQHAAALQSCNPPSHLHPHNARRRPQQAPAWPSASSTSTSRSSK